MRPSFDNHVAGSGEMKPIIRYIKPVSVVTLLVALAWLVTGCGDFTFPVPTSPEQRSEKAASQTTISTGDSAILAVYEHLLGKAESPEAKLYLAEFYTACDKWGAEPEIFKDGSRMWRVSVDMTSSETWKWRPHWQQAGWLVFPGGKVIPSHRYQANALRIEADLQELSLKPEP